MVMMVGEYDYEGIFTPVDESYGEQVFYYRASNIFFALFVVVMTILVMNLLVSSLTRARHEGPIRACLSDRPGRR